MFGHHPSSDAMMREFGLSAEASYGNLESHVPPATFFRMRAMKSLPSLFFAAWLICLSSAFANDATRVACLGDSITAGARVDGATQSYPARLQKLLGNKFEIRNFGLGSATLIKAGRPNVWQQLDAVKRFNPQVVVISLGTNDTVGARRNNWENIGQFEDDYVVLVDFLAALPAKPRIVLCTPTPMVLNTPGLSDERLADLRVRQGRLQELCKRVRKLAKEQADKNVSLLELNAVFQGKPELLTEGDGVHPNADGYLAIARAVAKHIRRPQPRPNIVLFLVDDMGWQDTSVPFHSRPTDFNRRYRTPNMEKLAQAGMKFTQAYACCVCSPTRVSLMTGLNAARHRVTNWTLRKNGSNDRKHPQLQFPKWNVNGLSPVVGIERSVHATALPAFLREAGYRTIHAGKAHFGAVSTPGSDPLNLGFDKNIGGHAAGGPGSFLGTQNFSAAWRNGDRVWDVPGLEAYHGSDVFLTEALTLEANKAVDQAVADERPFFLYMAHYAVHVPFAKDLRFYQGYRDRGLDHTESMYAAMVEGMDKSLGDIMANVERHELTKDTIFLFMSDNGGLSAHGRGGKPHTHNKPLSSGKGSAREGGVRVPMLVSWPGVTATKSSCDQPIMIEDFFTTILEMAEISNVEQVGGTIDGKSFVPLLRGQDDPSRNDRPLFWHFPNNWGPHGPGIGPSSAIRQGNWKLIYYHDSRGYELFDLSKDIAETNNLADENPQIRMSLAAKLGSYLESVQAQMPIQMESGTPVPYPGR